MRGDRAFSLVEVTLSIGIMAFTMIPLVALLGTGLQVGREAEEQNQSSRLMTLVTQSLLAAHESGGGQTASAPLDDVTWSRGAALTTGPLYFDRDLRRVATLADGHYAIYLHSEEVPAGELRRMAAVVAWPAMAEAAWVNERAEVTRQTGYLQNLTHWSE